MKYFYMTTTPAQNELQYSKFEPEFEDFVESVSRRRMLTKEIVRRGLQVQPLMRRSFGWQQQTVSTTKVGFHSELQKTDCSNVSRHKTYTLQLSADFLESENLVLPSPVQSWS